MSKDDQQQPEYAEVCPTCGHCPTCGQQAQRPVYLPYPVPQPTPMPMIPYTPYRPFYPWMPQPYGPTWQVEGNPIVTCGGGNISVGTDPNTQTWN
jgi:hypothetical protein